jgi:glucose/arabinose dehydrogenase
VARNPLAVALALAAMVLAACGEKDEPELTGPPVVEDTGGAQDGGTPTGDGRGGVDLEEIGDFESPVFLAQPEGEHALYVVEKDGRILRVAGDARRPQVFLDLSREVGASGSEQGLLSMAFAPDYRRTGRFYVDYTNREGDTRVVEYRRSRRDETEADPDTGRVILRVAQPYTNHNGGLVLFGPDGNLYVGLGDGGSAGDPQRNGQDLGTLLGKILRIDPHLGGSASYRIPKGNPFAGRDDARPEILAYGLRNPWRFSFDRETGALWIGDVGQNAQEEIDVVESVGAGANLGWSAYEGTARFNEDQNAPSALEPVLTYGRDEGCSVTGGYVVRDRALPTLYGRYLYADYCVGQLRSFSAADAVPGPADDDLALGVQVPSISSFAEDVRGHVYAISLEGPVYRLEAE